MKMPIKRRPLYLIVFSICALVVIYALDERSQPELPSASDRAADRVEACIESGLEQYDDSDTDPYLEDQTRDDVKLYWTRACRELEKRQLLERGGKAAPARELRPVAAEVLQGMIDSGELPPPQTPDSG